MLKRNWDFASGILAVPLLEFMIRIIDHKWEVGYY
jgi:hypothetical protein